MQIAPRQYAAWVRSQKLGKCACGNKQIGVMATRDEVIHMYRHCDDDDDDDDDDDTWGRLGFRPMYKI